MAVPDLTFLSAPNFPQVLDSVIARLVPLIEQAEARANLTTCFFESEHCDCRELGTVHHLASEQEFCERHFREVSRG